MQETHVHSLSQEDPLEEGWEPLWQSPVFLPGVSHGQNSLVGYVHRVTRKWLSAHSQLATL